MGPGRIVAVLGSILGTGCAALLGIDEGAYVGLEDGALDSGADGSKGPPAEVLARLQTGLVGYWRFDGNGRDSSDGGADLNSVTPEPQTYDAGLVGAAWEPSRASDDGFERDAGSPLIQIQHDFTISVWVKPDPSLATDTGFDYGIFDNDQVRIFGEAFNVGPAPCRPALLIMNGRATVFAVRDPVFDFRSPSNRGRWNHVIAFRRGTTLGLRINEFLTTTTQTAPGGEGPPGTFRVGAMSRGHRWQGGLDELGLWNRALDANEIDALYNGGNGVSLFR